MRSEGRAGVHRFRARLGKRIGYSNKGPFQRYDSNAPIPVGFAQAGAEIIGVGGVSCTEDVREKLDAGADVVQICTAVNSNPFIAQEIRQEMSSRFDTQAAAKFSGHSVAFSDGTVLAAFEATAKACETLRVPFEVGLQALHQNWLTGYLAEIESLKAAAPSGFRTRRDSPKQEQIADWIKE